MALSFVAGGTQSSIARSDSGALARYAFSRGGDHGWRDKARHPTGQRAAFLHELSLFGYEQSRRSRRRLVAGDDGQHVGLHLVPLLNQESLRFKHAAN